MINTLTGDGLLDAHQELDIALTQSGRAGLISLIQACIDRSWCSEEAILAKVQQIAGPYYDVEVPQLLALHASPLVRPQLWECDQNGVYRNLSYSFQSHDACCCR